MKDRLPNIKAVADYLLESGWKCSQRTVYNHSSKGRIHRQSDGTVLVADADRYATEWLQPSEGQGGPIQKRGAGGDKSAAEVAKEWAMAEHWQLRNKIKSGEYVPREDFERHLASRAAIFKSDIENFFRTHAGDIIRLVDGDAEKIPDLIDMGLKASEAWLDRYSQPVEFETPRIEL